VGVATLTGTILARSRRLPTRILVPTLLFGLSTDYFLPQTTANVASYACSVGDAHFPGFAQARLGVVKEVREGVEKASAASKVGRERVGEVVRWGVDGVQELTGLKIREGWGGGAENGEK
jgi:MICOS complex subunit MIC26